jgi:hypothetical protein
MKAGFFGVEELLRSCIAFRDPGAFVKQISDIVKVAEWPFDQLMTEAFEHCQCIVIGGFHRPITEEL